MIIAPSPLYIWKLVTPIAVIRYSWLVPKVVLQVCSRAGPMTFSVVPHLADLSPLSGSDPEEVTICLGNAVSWWWLYACPLLVLFWLPFLWSWSRPLPWDPHRAPQTWLAMYEKLYWRFYNSGVKYSLLFFFLLRIQATLIASTEIRFSRSGSFLLKRDDFFPGQLIAGLPIPFKKHCPIPIARTAYRSVVWLWLLQFLTWCTDIITFLKVWVSHSVLSLHTWDDLSLHWFT